MTIATQTGLLSPFSIRKVVSRNRIVISPMCLYSAREGIPNDFHLVSLGRYATGGAGIVIAEATAIAPEGRISHGDTGLYDDGQIEPWARIADFIARHGAVPAIQLNHAGRKASTSRPWEGGGSSLETTEGPEPRWRTIAPSPVAAEGMREPAEMSEEEIHRNIAQWAQAARRAVEAGFRIIEIHGAHGYLIHQFLAPQANFRTDGWGGDFAGRSRLAREVVRAVRQAIGEDIGLFYRMSVADGSGTDAWTVEDSVRLGQVLAQDGVDLIDCSSGGMRSPTPTRAIPRTYGFQVPLAEAVRRGSGLPVMAVGLIIDPHLADRIVRDGQADLVAIGREALHDPNWPARAELALARSHAGWSEQYEVWLDRRAATLEQLEDSGGMRTA